MSIRKGIFGFSSTETRNLYRVFWSIKDDCEWNNHKEFIEWASRFGYTKGRHLIKIDPSKKHGPDNSMYYDPVAAAKERQEKRNEYVTYRSPFCESCEKENCLTNGSLGCLAWREYWVKNWNEKIYVPPKEPEKSNTKRFWQYEHPDLVREGICFTLEI